MSVLKLLRVDPNTKRGMEDTASWAEKRQVWVPDEKQGNRASISGSGARGWP